MTPPGDDLQVEQLMGVEEAIGLLDAAELQPSREQMIALEAALGRVVANDIKADRDYPPFRKSLVDGFAVRSGDRGRRRVIGRQAAGVAQAFAIEANDAVAIMTGAPLPEGLDAVVPIEQTDAAGFDVAHLTIKAEPVPGRYVQAAASEAGVGDVVVAAGQLINAATMAALATVGAHEVRVIAPPRVGVLTTGDEVVHASVAPGGAQVRNSNGPLLRALAGQLGCKVIDLGHVADDPAAIRARMSSPMLEVLLVSGGMSMGAHDYVPRVLREMGYRLPITKLRIKPGKPFVWATGADADAGPAHVFGLPGNPVSAFVCMLRLASRLILRMQKRPVEPRWQMAPLAEPLPAGGPREFYQPAVVDPDGRARVFAWQGSADVFTLARANALLVRPENDPPRRAGEGVRLMEVLT